MSSASPENVDEMFVGVDPDDTLEVKHKGATFIVGVLPVGLWDVFSTRAMVAFEDSRRRAIATIAAKGLDPEETIKDLPRWWVDAGAEEQFLKERHAIEAEAVRYGLRGHIKFSMGQSKKEVPFETETSDVDGEKVQIVSLKTMRTYRANPGLVSKLYQALQSINELSVTAKKV